MLACITSDSYDDWLGGYLDADALMQPLDRECYVVAHDLERHSNGWHIRILDDVRKLPETDWSIYYP